MMIMIKLIIDFNFFISNLIKFTIMTTFNNKTFWDNIVLEEDAI